MGERERRNEEPPWRQKLPFLRLSRVDYQRVLFLFQLNKTTLKDVTKALIIIATPSGSLMTCVCALSSQTMRAVKKDVTRHRYGDEAHLDTTVKFLGLVMPRGDYPQLQWIMEARRRGGKGARCREMKYAFESESKTGRSLLLSKPFWNQISWVVLNLVCNFFFFF